MNDVTRRQTSPIFVDGSGRRRRWVTVLGVCCGLGLAGFIVLIMAGLLGASPVPLPGFPSGGQAEQVGGSNLGGQQPAASAVPASAAVPSSRPTTGTPSAAGLAPTATTAGVMASASVRQAGGPPASVAGGPPSERGRNTGG